MSRTSIPSGVPTLKAEPGVKDFVSVWEDGAKQGVVGAFRKKL